MEEDVETPLEEELAIVCARGCQVRMEIYRFYLAGGDGTSQVKFRFSADTDHFVMSPTALGTILGALAE